MYIYEQICRVIIGFLRLVSFNIKLVIVQRIGKKKLKGYLNRKSNSEDSDKNEMIILNVFKKVIFFSNILFCFVYSNILIFVNVYIFVFLIYQS